MATQTLPLPSSWTTYRPNRLSDTSVIKSSISEIGLDSESSSLLELVSILTSRIENGPLGKLASGETVFGHTIHGHRTELPFTHSREVNFNPITHGPWTPEGHLQTTIESQAIIQIEGLIDLVICTQDEHGRPTIRAVDIKTDGSMADESHTLNLLRMIVNPDQRTNSICSEDMAYNFQYITRHLKNESPSSRKESQAFAPPAIVWAKNGRMIAYPKDMLRDLRKELENYFP